MIASNAIYSVTMFAGLRSINGKSRGRNKKKILPESVSWNGSAIRNGVHGGLQAFVIYGCRWWENVMGFSMCVMGMFWSPSSERFRAEKMQRCIH